MKKLGYLTLTIKIKQIKQYLPTKRNIFITINETTNNFANNEMVIDILITISRTIYVFKILKTRKLKQKLTISNFFLFWFWIEYRYSIFSGFGFDLNTDIQFFSVPVLITVSVSVLKWLIPVSEIGFENGFKPCNKYLNFKYLFKLLYVNKLASLVYNDSYQPIINW